MCNLNGHGVLTLNVDCKIILPLSNFNHHLVLLCIDVLCYSVDTAKWSLNSD